MGLKPDLEKMEVEKDFKRLLRTLKNDEDNNIRYKTAEVLIKLGWHPKNIDEKAWYDSAMIGKSTELCPKWDAKNEDGTLLSSECGSTFSRSWEITKLSFDVIKKDKELLLFPLLADIFPILFIVAMLFPSVITSFMKGSGSQSYGIAEYLIFFITYLGLAFIATFFNVCVVYTTKIRFEGGNATFWESINFARSKITLIFAWSVM